MLDQPLNPPECSEASSDPFCALSIHGWANTASTPEYSRSVKIGSIVIRCYEFDKMLAFWQEALHYVPRSPASDGWVVLRDPQGMGPNLSLDKAPGRRRARSRLHLDLYAADQAAEVERLIGLGATRYPWRYPAGADYVVLEDPDGNLFCVVQS